MSAGKHTPGPWRAQAFKTSDPVYSLGRLGVRVLDANGVVVAEAFPQPYPVHISMPNAKLLAAAPDLADALENVRASAQCGCTLREAESGHRSDCWLPHWLAVADAALHAAGRLP